MLVKPMELVFANFMSVLDYVLSFVKTNIDNNNTDI